MKEREWGKSRVRGVREKERGRDGEGEREREREVYPHKTSHYMQLQMLDNYRDL